MEVHHHGHHAGNKNWKSYFWEFLMLFLAVFCGFLAENFREHRVEAQRGRQYVLSFLEDLKIDNSQLDRLIPLFVEKDKCLDTLLNKVMGISEQTGANGAYKFMRQPYAYPDFVYTDRTIQQLKNAGGLRMIENKKVSDSIIAYDSEVKLYALDISEGVKDMRVPLMLMTFKLFDLSCCPDLGTARPVAEINFPDQGNLLTYDKQTIRQYYNMVKEIKRQFALYIKDLRALRIHNLRLQKYLNETYHLD